MTTAEIVSLIGAGTAVGATVIVPIIGNWLGLKGKKMDNDAVSRKEMEEYLKEQLKERDVRIKEITEETKKWRDLYYDQLGINQRQAAEIISLQNDNKDLHDRVTELQQAVKPS